MGKLRFKEKQWVELALDQPTPADLPSSWQYRAWGCKAVVGSHSSSTPPRLLRQQLLQTLGHHQTSGPPGFAVDNWDLALLTSGPRDTSQSRDSQPTARETSPACGLVARREWCRGKGKVVKEIKRFRSLIIQ